MRNIKERECDRESAQRYKIMMTKTLAELRAYHETCNGNKPNLSAITPSNKNADAKTAFDFLEKYGHTSDRPFATIAEYIENSGNITTFKTKRAHNGYALNIGNKRICETLAKKNGTYSTAVNGEYFRRAKLDTVITDATAKANGGYYVIERADKIAHKELLAIIRRAMIENNVAIA